MGPADATIQHDSTTAKVAKDNPESLSTDNYRALIVSGKYADCLSLLDAHCQHSTASRLRTLRLICETCLRSHDEQWWQVYTFDSIHVSRCPAKASIGYMRYARM